MQANERTLASKPDIALPHNQTGTVLSPCQFSLKEDNDK